ncbi:MAG: ribonuclease P protein component [Kofleriaceae bacterium]|nr:ribonuclease P protein component [Kofleriaceae bacterium]
MAAVDNSFPKSGRLRKRSDYLAVQRAGKSQHGRYFVVVCEKNGQGRLGISVSKKVGNAVIRNRVKRLVKEYVRCAPICRSGSGTKEERWLPASVDVVIIARKSAATASATELWADLSKRRLELYREASL